MKAFVGSIVLAVSLDTMAGEPCKQSFESSWHVETSSNGINVWLPPKETTIGLCRTVLYKGYNESSCNFDNKTDLAALVESSCGNISQSNFIVVKPIEDQSLLSLLSWIRDNLPEKLSYLIVKNMLFLIN